jgi:integrase
VSPIDRRVLRTAAGKAKPHLRVVAPATENRTVTPRRRKNADLRTREHLTGAEVEELIEAAKDNRYGQRDALMVLLTFRDGLRAAEICDLRWEQVDFKTATLHVCRVKNGTPATHPFTGREMRALRRHQRESAKSPFVFRARRATDRAGILAHGRARRGRGRPRHQSARAYVAPRLRLQAGK